MTQAAMTQTALKCDCQDIVVDEVFLLSLKSLLETGKGAPAPNEIKLDSWE
jgi:hypothetical protein